MGSAQNHEMENSRGVWGDSKVIMRIKKDLTSSVNVDDARS